MKELVVTYWEGQPQIAAIHYLRPIREGKPVFDYTDRYHDDAFLVDYDTSGRIMSVEIVSPSKARALLNGLLVWLGLSELTEAELRRLE